MMRKFLIGLGAVVVLLVAAALIGPHFIDWNSYKPEIARQVKAATGRDLVIDGNLDLTLLPSLRLTVRNARLANIKGGTSPDMVRLKALDINVRLLPLLEGRFEAKSIALIEPQIALERLADGRVNWDFTPPQAGGAKGAPSPAGTAPESRPGNRAIRLDNLRIEDGTLVYRDAVAGTEERLSDLTMQLEVRSLNGPFQAKGGVTVHGVPLTLEAAVGELKPTAAAPVNLLVTVPSAGARAELSGGAVIVGAAPRFTGKLNVSGKDLRRLVAALTRQSRTALPAMLAQPYLLKADLKGTDRGGEVDDLELELGGMFANGSVRITAGDRLRADAKLRMTRLDLDSWLASEKKAEAAGRKPRAGGSAPAKTKAGGKSAAAKAPFALPGIDATLDAQLSAITYNRQNIRSINLKASLSGGIARLDKLSLFLPGGGDATVTGLLTAQNGRPHYQGRIDAQADNLRGLLRWVGADVDTVPSSRLRKFAFSGNLSGDDAQVQLLGAKISVDTTRIDGAVTLALRARPAFGATVNIDSLDLDAYAPRSGAAPRKAAPAAADHAPSLTGGTASAGAGPLSALNDFDANLRLQVGKLTVRRIPVRNLKFDGTLVGGTMTVRNASVGDIGGARAAVSGTLGNFSGFPVFKGSVSADAKDIAGVLRLAGVTPPAGARSVGALRLRGKADARADRVDLDLALNAAGATVKLKGTTANLNKAPRIDATLTASHGDLNRLLRTFGEKPPANKLGPLDLTAQLKGGLDRLATSLSLKAAGGTLTSTGTVSNILAAPAFDMVIAASHPSVGDLARTFAPDYRPVGGKIGPLRIKATVKGTQSDYTLTALNASAGKISLQGSGTLSTGGARPNLTASLTAGDIDLNPFLPPKRAAAQSHGRTPPVPAPSGSARSRASAADGGHFSSEPFDLSALGLMDAKLSVAAKDLVYRQFRVDNPTIRGTLADSLLTLNQIAGKMYDGSFHLDGSLDARKVPTLKGNVSVQKANVGKALLQTTEFDISGGITDFTMQVAGSGDSPRLMVRSLDGSAKIASKNGRVKGFDLQAVSDRLKNLDNAVDFLQLFNASMGGGQTRFASLDGTFDIKNGVVSSNDVKLVADAGEMRAAGFADLPRWYMDFNGEFRLTEHPKAPPFGMRAVGPLDNPRRIFQFEKLQAYLLQRGIGTLLKRVFPKKGQQQAPANQQQQQQQQQPKKPRLEDIIPGLLKGLSK